MEHQFGAVEVRLQSQLSRLRVTKKRGSYTKKRGSNLEELVCKEGRLQDESEGLVYK